MKNLLLPALLLLGNYIYSQKAELLIPRGHSDNISCIAISPDNKYLASGSWDKSVKLWDLSSGKEIISYTQFNSWVRSVAFSPDGKKLAMGSDKEFRISDLSNNGKEIFKKDIHYDDISAIAFSPDNKLLITSGSSKNLDGEKLMYEIKIWNASTMVLLNKLEGTGTIVKLKFTGNNQFTALSNMGVLTVNAISGAILKNEDYSDKDLSDMSPDGKWVVQDGFEDGLATLDIIDRSSKEIVHTFHGQRASIKTVSFSPDSRYVVTGADDATIYLYDLQGMQLADKIQGNMSYPFGLCFTSDGKKLISGNYDKIIRVWNFPDLKLQQKMGGAANIIYNIALSPDGKSLAVMGTPGFFNKSYIQVFDFNRGTVVQHFESSIFGKGLMYSPDGKYLISGSFDGGMGVYNATTSEKITSFESEKSTSQAISPDGKIIASTNYDANPPTLLIRSFPSGNSMNSFKLPYSALTITFAKNSKSVFVGLASGDKTVQVDINTGNIIKTFYHKSEYESTTGIRKILVSNEGDKLITGDDYSRLRWWDIATGTELSNMNVQSGMLNDLIFMPGKNQLLTAAGESAFADTTIHITDAATKKIIRTLNGHNSSPTTLAVSPDGKFLFSGSFDRTVKVWDLSTGKVMATLVFFGSSDWVIVDKEGRFDGTQEGMKKMYFTKGLDILPLESAYEQFYTPNLLPRIIGGEKLDQPFVDINTLKAAPLVKIKYAGQQRNLSVENDIPSFNAVKEDATISVQADCPADGITEIRLFQNGKLVETTRNLTVEDENAAEKSLLKNFIVKLSPGDNTFKAIAFNTQRTESKPVEISIVYQPSNNNVSAGIVLHLMIVGVNTYKNPKYTLNYAKADAAAFRDELEKSNSLFSKVDLHYITDADALKDNIEKAFKEIASVSKPQDLFIFYYAGHGVMSLDEKSKAFYIVPYDVTQLYGDEDALAQKGISADELMQFSKDISAQKQLFILDACQSAGALVSVAMRGAAEEKAIAQLARSTGTHWLTASGSEQFATEFSQIGHGVFTYALLKGLAGAADNGDGQVTVNELKAYLEIEVPELTQKYRGIAQYPASYGYGNDFPVIIVK